MDHRKKDDWDARIFELVSAFEAKAVNTFLDPESYHDLIDFYELEEQFEKALTVARLAGEQYRFSADFYGRQAQLLLRTNRVLEAQELLEIGLTFTPGDFELQLLLGETYIRDGEIKRGLTLLESLKLQANEEERSELLLVEALAYEKSADYEQLFYTLRAAILLDQTNERALERLYLCTDLCGKHEDASQLFLEIIDENPYNSLAWFYLGHTYVYLRRYEEALDAFEYAFLSKADFEDAYLEFAELNFELGHLDKALEGYEEALERFGTDSDLLLRIGTCLHQMGQHETARHRLEEAARIEPYNDEVIFRIGECYAAQEKWSLAIAFFQKAIRMRPDEETYLLALAEAAFEQEDFALAEQTYHDALALAPDSGDIWLDLAWFLVEMLRPEDALALLSEAREAVCYAEVDYAYVACLFATGRRQEALARLSDVLTESYDAHTHLFEWHPLLRTDAEVHTLLHIHRPESR